MAPFPLNLVQSFGLIGSYLIYLVIGFAFGYVLEIAGFGHSPKLAAQFYFKELTVLKVMFGAIVTAMVLIFAATGAGLLDYNLIWVNPTYLWPGIVGGLIMGVGFIVGGFCPGTSLVAVSTLKLDGIFFTLGTLFGIFIFGETVGLFDVFFHSSYMGRLTIQDWLNLPTGVVVLIIVLMALFMFWGSEQLERIFGKRDLKLEPKVRLWAAAGLAAAAAALIFLGQPNNDSRWAMIAPVKEATLANREVQIHPGELLTTMHDHTVNLVMLDVRREADYNLFHIEGAQRIEPAELTALAKELQLEPANTVIVLMSNDEAGATAAWKILSAESVNNLYILEGGLNNWLATFAAEDSGIQPVSAAAQDALDYRFGAALGADYSAAYPDPAHFKLDYTPKIKLNIKKGPASGGCG
jgi:hypothetical protein